MDLDAYRARAQAFATDLNRAHHRRFAGHDGAWDPESLYAHHAAAYDDEAIEALRAAASAEGAREDPDRPGEQPARRLLRFAVEARLGRATARTDAARAQAEAQEGYADLTATLAREPALGRRVELEEERLDVVARRLTPLAAEGLERVRAETRALGWPSARAL
ncbi:MAG: family oligoendopeptidase, partial [Conexibacter sp.]|nr:family oligoendopeptidase [Conexibacter sp.]